LQITFYGVRGSCPCPSPQNQRYGGNTACTVLEMPGQPPIILDLGTGLRRYGEVQASDGSFSGTALLTHIHWDHVQGLPFFPPIDRAGAELQIYGPVQDTGTLGTVFGDFMRPPYFPVHFSELRGKIEFHDVYKDDLIIGEALVKARPVPHCGPTVGYRIEWGGVVVAYVSDHQAPRSLDTVSDSVLELCENADLLIHDAQYTPDEFEQKAHWGHCTIDYAVQVGKQAGVKTLSLFHHDPAHDDDTMDRLLAGAQASSLRVGGPNIVAAADGLTINL
jgi:phosphoribosyl 1,2-cyclic phosphodiesterase